MIQQRQSGVRRELAIVSAAEASLVASSTPVCGKALVPTETVAQSMDEAMLALSTFDADRLEAIKDRIHGMTVECLARELAEGREALPELLRKHTVLGEMLQATAANLKVVAAVLEAKRSGHQAGFHVGSQDRSNLVPWPR